MPRRVATRRIRPSPRTEGGSSRCASAASAVRGTIRAARGVFSDAPDTSRGNSERPFDAPRRRHARPVLTRAELLQSCKSARGARSSRAGRRARRSTASSSIGRRWASGRAAILQEAAPGGDVWSTAQQRPRGRCRKCASARGFAGSLVELQRHRSAHRAQPARWRGRSSASLGVVQRARWRRGTSGDHRAEAAELTTRKCCRATRGRCGGRTSVGLTVAAPSHTGR